MPISVQCDSCFQSYQVGDDKAGKAIKCKSCGSRIEVPAAERKSSGATAKEAPSRQPEKSPGKPASRGKKRKGGAGLNPKLLIGGGVAGVVVLVAVLVLVFKGGGGGGGARPAVSPDAISGWKAAPDAPTVSVTWPDNFTASIPVKGRGDEASFPVVPSPFVAIGFEGYESAGVQSWNLATGQQLGEIRGKPPNKTKVALSPDGRHLAVQVLDTKARNLVEIWSFETGEQVRKFDCDSSDFSLTIMEFSAPDQLLTYTFGQAFGGKFKHRLKLWNVVKGSVLRETEVPGAEFNQYEYAISPGGRYLATMLFDGKVLLYDVRAGFMAGKVETPTSSANGEILSGKALAFSPNGDQLAVLLDGPKETRITTIDMATGKRNSENDLSLSGQLHSSIDGSASYRGPKFEFLPKDAGYQLAGTLWIEAQTKRVVWSIDNKLDPYNHVRRLPVPGGAVALQGADKQRRVELVPIPWKDVQASLQAIESGQQARVRPRQAITIDVQVGSLQFGDPETTKTVLTETITRRLAGSGFEVKDGQPTVLQVNYEESAGITLSETQRNNQNPLAQVPTGRTVQATKGIMKVSWLAEAGKTSLWWQDMSVNPQFVVTSGEITPEKARESMFKDILNNLASQPIPFFLPAEGSPLIALPGTTPLKDAKVPKLN